MKIETIIFDMDGTIIDSELLAAQVVKTCFFEWKVNIKPEDVSYIAGRTWESAFLHLSENYTLPVTEAFARKEILTRYRTTLENEVQAVPGSVQAIKSFASNYALGLVSGSGRSEILWVLKKLDILQHFQVVLGAEDYPRSKPSPDGFLKALGILGGKPDSCLVFEDSKAGIASARAAGLWVAAITSTNHFNQDNSLAHVKIHDLTGIDTKWVQNLSLA